MRKELMIMARFVPKEKLSKKAQKELNLQRRVTWDCTPITKTIDSKKLYNRKKNARTRDDYGLGCFFISRLFFHTWRNIYFTRISRKACHYMPGNFSCPPHQIFRHHHFSNVHSLHPVAMRKDHFAA